MNDVLTLVEKTALLKMVGILATVPTESVGHLAARATEVRVEPGHYVFREGEPNRGSFLILEGLVEIRRQRTLLAAQSAGSVLGDLALSGQEPHVYTALAVEATHLLNVTPDDLIETLLEFPDVGIALVRRLSRRIQELTNWLAETEKQAARLTGALVEAGLPVPAPENPGAQAPPSGSRGE